MRAPLSKATPEPLRKDDAAEVRKTMGGLREPERVHTAGNQNKMYPERVPSKEALTDDDHGAPNLLADRGGVEKPSEGSNLERVAASPSSQ